MNEERIKTYNNKTVSIFCIAKITTYVKAHIELLNIKQLFRMWYYSMLQISNVHYTK